MSKNYGSIKHEKLGIPHDNWAIIIIGFCLLIGDMSRGIYFPTLYLNILRCGGDRVAQGIAVASFSAGRIVISPYFGKLSETIKHKKVLLFSNTIIALTSLLYTQASAVWAIILCQFLIGIGSGTLGVTRSYVAETTPQDKRSECMAFLTTMQYTGFAVFPIVGAALTSWAHTNPGNLLGIPFLPMNQFTLPAMFTCISTTALLTCLYYFFEDYRIDNNDEISNNNNNNSNNNNNNNNDDDDVNYNENSKLLQNNNNNNSSSKDVEADMDSEIDEENNVDFDAGQPDETGWSLADKLALGGCILNVTTKGTIGVYETLGVSLAKTELGWSNVHAGVLFACGGLGGVVSLLCFPWLVKTFGDIKLTIYGLGVMIVSLFLLVHWTTSDNIGETRFYCAIILAYTIGYPIGHTAELAMFSKISKYGPQGALQGWFGSAGSLGRVIYPILAGLLSEYINTSAIFEVAAVGLILSITAVVWHEVPIRAIIGQTA